MPIFCNLYSTFLTHTVWHDPLNISSLQVVSATLTSDVQTQPATVVWKSDPGSSSVRMTCAATAWLLVLPLMLLCVRDSSSLFLPDSKELRQLLSRYEEGTDETSNTSGNRTRRSIRWSDREEILQLHNKLRGGVYPTASNMEHMVRHVPLPQWPISPLWSINKDHYQPFFSLASPHRELDVNVSASAAVWNEAGD